MKRLDEREQNEMENNGGSDAKKRKKARNCEEEKREGFFVTWVQIAVGAVFIWTKK